MVPAARHGDGGRRSSATTHGDANSSVVPAERNIGTYFCFFAALPFYFPCFSFLSLFLSLCFCCMCVLFNGAGCAQFGVGVAGIIFLS